MHDSRDPLDDLKRALDSLSATDLDAWTAEVENRLTERLRLRQRLGSPAEDTSNPEEPPDA